MYKKQFQILGLFTFLFLWNGYSQNAQNPNIIVIIADDLGYADVGFNGCKDIPTPNIDRIAKNGVRVRILILESTLTAT